MLKRAHVAGVSVVSILTSPIDAAASASVLEFERCQLPVTAKPRQPAEAVAVAKARLEEELAGKDGRDSPSLRSITRELGVSEGFIRHQLPDLVRQFMSLRMRQSVLRTHKRTMAMRSVLEDGVLDDYFKGRINSQDAVVEILVARCGLGKAAARLELGRALKRRKETALG
jgi:hypothetical protein